MKKNLFLFILISLVFIPFNVDADTIATGLRYNPVSVMTGFTPTSTVHLEILKEDEVLYDYDVEVDWYHVQSDSIMAEGEVFKSEEAYRFVPKEESVLEYVQDLQDKDVVIAENPEVYINYVLIDDCDYFVADGVQYIDVDIKGFNVGNTPLETSVHYTYNTTLKSFEIEIGPFEWYRVDGEEYVLVNDDEKFVEGVEYVFDWTVAEGGGYIVGDEVLHNEIELLTDYATHLVYNNEKVDMYTSLILKPDPALIKIDKQYKNIVDSLSITKMEQGTNYEATLFADLDYVLPETIKVLIGEDELDSSKYTYNSTTGELIISGDDITDDLTIIANGVLVKNPDTSDNIMISILISIISVVSVLSVTLYLKKEVK